MSRIVSYMVLGFLYQALTLCELGQITKHVVQEGERLSAYSQQGDTPRPLLVDTVTMMSVAERLTGSDFSRAATEQLLGEQVRSTTRSEAIRCAPNGTGCTVVDDGLLIEFGGYAWDGTDRLALEVSYSYTVRRRSGNTGVCVLPVRLNLSRVDGRWRLDTATPLRRC